MRRSHTVKPVFKVVLEEDPRMEKMTTLRFRVYGIVQGVGFRPTVDRHAQTAGIRGSVCNKGPYVEIYAQGTPDRVDRFRTLLNEKPPRRAAILKIDEKAAPEAPVFDAFSIVESEKTSGEIYISPDIAICEECEAELFDPGNRRYLHPFINCTCCGPRMTILDALPYDRERTSMKMFPMCKTCADEYYGPWSRRYDAQPVCCNDCGPEVYLLPVRSETEKNNTPGAGSNARQKGGIGTTRGGVHSDCIGRDAITAARRTILDGGIVAVKGIGGFHLCCDATNEAAVSRLRARKRRPAKPFAVMMRDEATVRRECLCSEAQHQIMTGHQKPILLLERSGSRDAMIAPSVAPGNPTIGVMLPYAPLQHLLFRYDDGLTMPDCLVMTSGNVSGAPICRDDNDALAELSGFCDCILSHDRLIRIRADDSVMDFHRDRPYMIRRSRGYAPLPVLLSGCGETTEAGKTDTRAGTAKSRHPGTDAAAGETRHPGKSADAIMTGRHFHCVLATGGELKNSFCIGSGSLLYLSPYIGDLEDLRTVRALEETIGRMETLLEVKPEAVVCDLHPKYNSTMVAEDIAQTRGIPIYRIQHHYAHILSCMAENDYADPVIGVSFDGTGFGTDGTIWGGEILVADYNGFTRQCSIEPFVQIGGDSAPRQGWRITASMIWSLCRKGILQAGDAGAPPVLYVEEKKESARYPVQKNAQGGTPDSVDPLKSVDAQEAADLYFSLVDTLALCDAQNAKAQRMMAERGIQAVRSTSAGRLFDAVSAMLGICRQSTYEGEASIELQFAAERYIRKMTDPKAGSFSRPLPLEDRVRILRSLLTKTDGARGRAEEKGVTERTDRAEEKSAAGTADTIRTSAGEGQQKQQIFSEELFTMPTDLLFADLLRRHLDGEDPEKLAYEFHADLAEMTVEACVRISEKTGIRTVALSGGCWQNRLLLTLTEDGLLAKGMTVLTHHLVPPNDGGIALGQAAAIMMREKG